MQSWSLACMLDDTMGPAVLVASDGGYSTTTIDMTVSFLAPARSRP
jgi:acyl-coenzyme A thioesterase PaaI-like protein